MTRKKVTLAFITNDSERKASFKKRKKGLIKKVNELTTLCGVEACAIIYSPYEPVPEVWPSRQGAEGVLTRFRELSEMDQTRKMVNQEAFTRQRIKKAQDQLRRLQKENKRKELENFMYQCMAGMASVNDFNLCDAAEMNLVMNQTMREINARMEAIQKAPAPHHEDTAAHDVMMPPPTGSPSTGGSIAQIGGVDGWDVGGMVPPYPYFFNNFNSSTSAAGTTSGSDIN
ncbi:hypothetical protein ACJIZ3_016467 [Penstemon smallii]|uniref:MADS-box domain-containing protein n=1 Tax=Penstemon smallii TaxID=265156 RepID=A0ABD3RQI0_9LAMI